QWPVFTPPRSAKRRRSIGLVCHRHAHAAVGVNAITVMPLSADPAEKLEAMFGPVMDTIRNIEPAAIGSLDRISSGI
ncbi:hypothetical protein, partial [Sphingobium mellinum]|uniref:hypothetical protein n=1 Tax=Sphingobium mellinum TaxID=1387166 RepID=UPI0030EE3EBF